MPINCYYFSILFFNQVHIYKKLGPKDPAIMDSFIEPIGGFIALLAIGVMCGGLGFVSAYRNNS